MTTIVTKRLRLLPKMLAPSMIQQMVVWLNNEEVVRYSEQRHAEHTIESQIKYLLRGPDELRHITIDADDKFIGNIAASIDKYNSVADVGILIGEKSEWGKGYGTEAWQAFCDHLLSTKVRKIEAGTMSCNLGMIHIFEKTGMHEEGCRKDHFMLTSEGGYITKDLVQWARFI